jgi:hypothetical protein
MHYMLGECLVVGALAAHSTDGCCVFSVLPLLCRVARSPTCRGQVEETMVALATASTVKNDKGEWDN